MLEYNELFDLLFSNIKKLLYPEEWINLDFALSKSEIFAMLLVDRNGEVIMSQISSYINIPTSTATGIVDRLVKNGFMKRERSESDRRIVTIRLTDRGKEIVESLKNFIMERINAVNENLTEDERGMLYNIFIKVIDILNKKNEEAEGANPSREVIRKIEIE